MRRFLATWCVPCREQMPHFERTFENAGADLLVLAVVLDGEARVRRRVEHVDKDLRAALAAAR